MMGKIKVVLLTLVFVVLSSCTNDTKEVIVASKNFTENIILGEMMAQVIEAKTDIEVTQKQNMGSTFVVYSALKSGDIDMYPDYTGTIYQAHLNQKEQLSVQETYEYAKQGMAELDIRVLESMGFNNTYAIGMLREKADALGLEKVSDLVNNPELIVGFDPEFVQRSDGGLAMMEAYGLSFDNEIVQLEIGLKLRSLASGDIDLTDAFSTDSKLLRYDIKVLEDDLNFFPPYYPVPLVREDTLEKYPEIIPALESLANILTEEEIMQLNYAVEDDKLSPTDVVRTYLESKNIIN